MAEQRPLVVRDQFHQGRFDFLWRFLVREAQPIRETRHVRINYDADVNAEGIAQNDVGRFAADAVELRQFIHRPWHFATVLFDQLLAARFDAHCFITEKSQSLDGLLQI
jgi:hypothetical protein